MSHYRPEPELPIFLTLRDGIFTVLDEEPFDHRPEERHWVLGVADALPPDYHLVPANLHQENRLTLSVEEAAEALGISRALAYEAVRRNEIPHVKIGRRLLVPRVALERMLALSGDKQGNTSSDQ